MESFFQETTFNRIDALLRVRERSVGERPSQTRS
jgi:hypothetical protein